MKTKTILLASWMCTDKNNYQGRDWIPILKKLFKEVTIFSPRDIYFKYGKKAMNQQFLNLVKRKKPDYILFSLSYDEFYIETLPKIKIISPETKIINFFGDDSWRFDDYTRYYALFFDYIWTTENNFSFYKKDGINNVYSMCGVNEQFFKPLNIPKKYDVTFIGMPIRDRAEYIRYLMDNGIKVKLFGLGWENFPEFKEIYGGFLNSENYTKVINQSKINLNFSKSFLNEENKNFQLKGRIVEIFACKGFLLTENFSSPQSYFKDKSKITFNTKEELLKKIRYFLINEKEREAIALKLYNETTNKYTWKSLFKDFFKKIEKSKSKIFHPLVFQKSIILDEEDMIKSIKELKKKTQNADYISFSKGKNKTSKYKEYFQIYSLEKSGKPISCCDYNLYSEGLGNYALFMSKKGFKSLSPNNFISLLNINQIMVSKKYFFNNFSSFQIYFSKDFFGMINEKNTVFVSIPLVRIEESKIIDYDIMKTAFKMEFLYKVHSLIHQRKFLNKYFYNILKKPFILKYLFNYIFENWKTIKKFRIK